MTRQINEIDHLYVVPLDAMSVADAFANGENDVGVWRLSYDAQDLPLVSEDDRPVLEVLEEIPGGCLVRIGALANQVDTLAKFLDARNGPATLVLLEQSCGRAEMLVQTLGGHVAERSKGRWRPVDEDARQAWGAHLVQWNAQKLRAKTAMTKAAKPYNQAAAVLARTLQSA